MSDRTAAIKASLANTHWRDWEWTPLQGDASSRRYVRLSKAAKSAILMDAGPALATQTSAFIAMGDWLCQNGLRAPEIYFQNTDLGIVLLEDLGPDHFAQWITRNPDDTAMLYAAANDALVALAKADPPKHLTKMTPDVGGDMVRITGEWYAENAATDMLAHAVTSHLQALCGPAETIALRDFHAENLIWRPDAMGLQRVGLLDFQDAFIAPIGYDLVSLLRDVRRKVDPNLAKSVTGAFCDALALDHGTASAAFACLAVQRNLRILGVFARLARQDGKIRYIAMIPRIWDMLNEDLAHPALAELRAVVMATLPSPDASAIRDFL